MQSNEKTGLRVFLEYLLSRLPNFAVYALIISSFWIVGFLNGYPFVGLAYSLLLATFVIAIFEAHLGYRSYKLYTAYKMLCAAKSSDYNAGIRNSLSSNGFDGAIYLDLLKYFVQKKDADLALCRNKVMDAVDYYGLWVHQIKTPLFALNLAFRSGKDLNKDYVLLQLSSIEDYVEMAIKYIEIDDFNRDIVFENFDLDYLLKSVLKQFSRAFAGKRIKLEYTETHKRVLSDFKWLSFAVGQIISNSIKYSGEGGVVSISGQSEKDDSGKTTYVLCIKDYGRGILKEDLPRVFDKGFTGQNGRDISKSTGIGLYVCKKVLDKLGHSVKIDSIFGEWTELSVNIGALEK